MSDLYTVGLGISAQQAKDGMAEFVASLATGGQAAKQLQADVNQTFKGIAPDAGRSGTEAARALIGGITHELDLARAFIKDAASRGLITADQAREAGRAAATAYNEEVRKVIDGGIASSAFSTKAGQETYIALANALQRVETQAAASGKATAQALVAGLTQELDHANAFIKDLLTRGLISPEQARQAGREAAIAYNAGLQSAIDKGNATNAFKGAEGVAAYTTLAGALVKVEETGNKGANGLNAFKLAAQSAAATALAGVPGVGQLGGIVGSFALSTLASAGILAGIAAIGYGYNKITQSAREAAKAADEFSKTQQSRIAETTAVGIVQTYTGVSNGKIPALSGEAETAQKAIDGINKELDKLPRAFESLDQLTARVRSGRITSQEFAAALKAVAETPNLGQFYSYNIEQLGKFGARAIAAREELARLNATILQGQAVNNYYQRSGALDANEGATQELIAQRRRVLAAYQSGGVVAGRQAEDSAAAITAAKQAYEEYAKSGKDATISTLVFQDALKQGNPIAQRFVDEARQLVAVNRAIANTQTQQTTTSADATKFTALADAIARVQAEAQSFGKDGSIDAKIRGLDDQVDHFIDSLRDQVATGKLSQRSFEEQAAAAEGLRQKLYEAGQAMRDAFDAQVTKQINDEYASTKQLFDALIDGRGSYTALTAAKQADLEIGKLELQLGHQLSDADRQRIVDRKNLEASIDNAKLAQSLHDQTAAISEEISAIQSGRSTRVTYAADLLYQNQLRAASLEQDPKVKANLIAEIEALHQKSVALAELKDGTTKQADAAAQLQRDLLGVNATLEKDLLRGIQQFASHGLDSFRSFFEGVARLSTNMVSQIDGEIAKLRKDLETALPDDLVKQATDQIKQLEAVRTIVASASAVANSGLAGYNFGQQAQGTGNGVVGGAAVGAITGFSVLGPIGAAVGGLVGAASGLIGAADAQKQAAQRIADASKKLDASVESFLTSNPVKQQLIGVGTQADSLQQAAVDLLKERLQDAVRSRDPKAIEDAFAKLASKLQEIAQGAAFNTSDIANKFSAGIVDQLNAFNGAAGAYVTKLAEIDAAYKQNIESATLLGTSLEQVNELHERQLAAAKAEYEESVRQQKFSLDAREAYAKGETALGDILSRRAQEDKERYQAERDGWSDADKARQRYIEGLEDEATALEKLKDAQGTLAQALASGPTGTLGDKQAADRQPLFDKLAADQRDYDAAVKLLNDDLAAGADAATIAADRQNVYTQSVILAGDQALIASAKWQDAIAGINQAISDIQQDVSLGFITTKEGLDKEADAFGFGGLSIDQIRGKYKTYDPNAPLTNEDRETNREITQFIRDYDRVNGTTNGKASLAQTGGVASPAAADERVATASAAAGITEVTGNRLADYSASQLVELREIKRLEQKQADFFDRLGGGALPSFAGSGQPFSAGQTALLTRAPVPPSPTTASPSPSPSDGVRRVEITTTILVKVDQVGAISLSTAQRRQIAYQIRDDINRELEALAREDARAAGDRTAVGL